MKNYDLLDTFDVFLANEVGEQVRGYHNYIMMIRQATISSPISSKSLTNSNYRHIIELYNHAIDRLYLFRDVECAINISCEKEFGGIVTTYPSR